MRFEDLAKALKIEIEGNPKFEYLLKLYEPDYLYEARLKALEVMILDRITELVEKVEDKGENYES